MKLTCDEATKICDKSQYKEASLVERIKLGIHLFFCKKCGLYSKQNSMMSTCYKIHKNELNGKEHCLNEEDKKHIDKELKARIKPSAVNVGQH